MTISWRRRALAAVGAICCIVLAFSLRGRSLWGHQGLFAGAGVSGLIAACWPRPAVRAVSLALFSAALIARIAFLVLDGEPLVVRDRTTGVTIWVFMLALILSQVELDNPRPR